MLTLTRLPYCVSASWMLAVSQPQVLLSSDLANFKYLYTLEPINIVT